MKNTIKTKKDCGPDKILNMKTNRCVKKKKQKKCGPDKILNMETNRCIKNSREIPQEIQKLIQFVSHPKVSFFIILFTSLHYKKLIFDSTVNLNNIYTLRLWEIFNYRRILGISFSYILLYYQLYSSKPIDEKRIELFLITGSYALLLKYEDAVKLFIETYLWSKLLDFLRKLFQQPTEEEEQQEEEKECECDCDQTQQPPDDSPNVENPIRQIINQMVKGIGNVLQNIVYSTGSKIVEGIKYLSYEISYYIFIKLPYYIFIYPFVFIYDSIFTKVEISDFQKLMKDIKNQVEEKIKQTKTVQKENLVKIYQTVLNNVLQDPVKRDIVYQEAFPSKKTNLSDLVQGKPYEPLGNWNAKKAKQSLEHKPFFVGPDYFQQKILLPAMKKNKNLKLRPYIRKTKNTLGDEFYLIQYEYVEENDPKDPDTIKYPFILSDSNYKDKMLVSYESDKSPQSSMFLPTDQKFLQNMNDEIYGVQPTDPVETKGILTVVVRLNESFEKNIKQKLDDAVKIFNDVPRTQLILTGLTAVLGIVTVGGMLYYDISTLEVPYVWDILNGLKDTLKITYYENPQLDMK